MNKLKLDMEALKVDSFTTSRAAPAAGTVRGHITDMFHNCGPGYRYPFTYNITDTLGDSCQYTYCGHCGATDQGLTGGQYETQLGSGCDTFLVSGCGGTCEESRINCPTDAYVCQ